MECFSSCVLGRCPRQMKTYIRSSILFALIACVFGFYSALTALFLPEGATALIITGIGSLYGTSTLFVVAAASIIASIIGLVGGLLGMKEGGAMMICGAIIAIACTSLSGMLLFALLLFGGVMAVRGRETNPAKISEITSPIVAKTTPTTTPPSITSSSSSFALIEPSSSSSTSSPSSSASASSGYKFSLVHAVLLPLGWSIRKIRLAQFRGATEVRLTRYYDAISTPRMPILQLVFSISTLALLFTLVSTWVIGGNAIAEGVPLIYGTGVPSGLSFLFLRISSYRRRRSTALYASVPIAFFDLAALISVIGLLIWGALFPMIRPIDSSFSLYLFYSSTLSVSRSSGLVLAGLIIIARVAAQPLIFKRVLKRK